MPRRLVETKYFQLAQKLREQIRLIPPGEKLPTIDELRQQFQISRGTVDQVLERLQNDGLIHRPSGRQRYVVATIPDHAVRRIVLVRPDYPSPSFEAMARTVVEAGKRADWAFDQVYYRSLQTLDLRRAINDHDAGVLIPTSEAFPSHLLRVLKRPHHPIVVVQVPLAGLAVSNVCLDDFKIGFTAADCLLSLGHRRIAVVLDQPHIPVITERLAGWRMRLEQVGEVNLDELVVDGDVQPGEDAKDKTFQRVGEWLDRPHPAFTAVFCTSDFGAMATLRALSERGIRVPQDVSLIAHGGESNLGPFLFPPLTAVETDLSLFGKMVVSILDDQLEKPNSAPRQIRLAPVLVPRQTTRAIIAAAPRRALRHDRV